MMTQAMRNTNFDTIWNMHDLVNDLIDDLRMTRANFVSEIARGLDDSEKSSDILNVLEYYHVLVLEEVKSYMKKYSKSLFELIQKRRLVYVEKVRRGEVWHNQDKEDNTVDLTRDQDDTANLACGMGIIGRGIDKIERIIQKKTYLIEQEKKGENLRWWGTFFTFTVVFILGYILVDAFIM